MKQPRRWTVLLVALLMVATLVFAPREGSAGPRKGQILAGDPPPTPEMGEPEVPVHPAPSAATQVPVRILLVARTMRVDLLGVFILANVTPEIGSCVRDARKPSIKRAIN